MTHMTGYKNKKETQHNPITSDEVRIMQITQKPFESSAALEFCQCFAAFHVSCFQTFGLFHKIWQANAIWYASMQVFVLHGLCNLI